MDSHRHTCFYSLCKILKNNCVIGLSGSELQGECQRIYIFQNFKWLGNGKRKWNEVSLCLNCNRSRDKTQEQISRTWRIFTLPHLSKWKRLCFQLLRPNCWGSWLLSFSPALHLITLQIPSAWASITLALVTVIVCQFHYHSRLFIGLLFPPLPLCILFSPQQLNDTVRI